MKNSLPLASAFLMAVLSTGPAYGAGFQVFSENFDVDNTAGWTENPGASGNHDVDFFFDYSTVGIPPAPNSAGTTIGMKLMANFGPNTPGVAYGISASPNGLNVQGDYEVRFDMWCNFNGPAPGGGNGSTHLTGAGIGSSGTYANYPGRVDGVWMAVTGDGGSGDDYRAYSPAFNTSYQYNSDGGIYPSGTHTTTRNNTNSYWATNFPGQTIPASQTAVFSQQTGTTQNGAQAFKWRDVLIRKTNNVTTFYIDNVLIATVNLANAGNLGGGNILFMQADINATISTDPNRTSLLFGLIDNIRVTNLTSAVSVTTSTTPGSESGTPVVFTLTRNDPSPGNALTVDFTLTGAAVNGTDYQTVPLSATIPAGLPSVDVVINPTDDSESEFEESVILTLQPSTAYSLGTTIATATITDNDTPMVSIEAFRPSAYERVSGDYVTFRLVRKGDTSSGALVNINYSGTAPGTKYNPEPVVALNGGNVYEPFNIMMVDNSTLDGDQTIIATVAPGGDYLVDSNGNSATATIIDDELPPEGVLFSEDFNTAGDAANWVTRFAAGNGVSDYEAVFGYDYSSWGIPPAPHGTDQTGLYLTVNKADSTALGAAGVNVYPLGQSFSGDYAVRFDMFLLVGGTSTSEYALMGINHSGDRTNWFRLSSNGYTNSVYDGIWASVESDATGADDYLFHTSPVINRGAVWGPTRLASTDARFFTNIFKAPPWFAGAVPGGSPAVGQSDLPGNWADVELSQVKGVVTLKINRATIMTYTNTTSHTQGNLMLGYADPFDSIGVSAFVIYDNLRVIDMTTDVTITGIDIVGGNVEITFRANLADTIGAFALEQTGTLPGGFSPVTASFSSLGGGMFKATRALSPGNSFFRIRKN